MTDEEKIASLEDKLARQSAITDQLLEAVMNLWGVSVVRTEPDRSRYLDGLVKALEQVADLRGNKHGRSD